MQQGNIGLVVALWAGVVSFVSPCVLPLVPAYLSYMSGVSLAELQGASRQGANLRRVLLSSLAFVLGFSLVFIALGATASALGQRLAQATPIIMRAMGVLVIILGVHMTGLVRIPFLAYEKRFQAGQGAGLVTSFLMGLAFAFGWTPCIGPILAAILTVAANEHTVGRGILLLAVYSAGLGIPFILAGLFLNVFYAFFRRIQNHFHTIEVVSGAILIAIGLLLVFNKFTLLSGWFARLVPLNVG